MKTKLALSAFVAAFVLSACGSKTEAPAPVTDVNVTTPATSAPAADAAASAAADSAAAANSAAEAASSAASAAQKP